MRVRVGLGLGVALGLMQRMKLHRVVLSSATIAFICRANCSPIDSKVRLPPRDVASEPRAWPCARGVAEGVRLWVASGWSLGAGGLVPWGARGRAHLRERGLALLGARLRLQQVVQQRRQVARAQAAVAGGRLAREGGGEREEDG